MKNANYNNLTKQCKTIIENNSPEDSMKKISNIKLSDKKVGKETAFKIYKAYSDESVKYDSKKYENNINQYKNKVNSNVEKAKKVVG